MPDSDGRHTCQFRGCGKSFARKEHLSRHAQSHQETNRHVCQLCHREFSRCDSLHRHLRRHGGSPRPSPSGRSKHACVACHSSKIKCDGSRPCSACLKRDIEECRYELRDEDPVHAAPEAPALGDVPAVAVPDAAMAMHRTPTPAPRPDLNQTASPDPELPGLADRIPPPEPAVLRIERDGPVDWLSMTIQRNPPNVPDSEGTGEGSEPKSINRHKDLYPLTEAASRKYLHFYFTYFHHRWTVIHTPSLTMRPNFSLVVSATRMIGAWISGTQDARWLAISMHERLMAHILPQLLQISSSDNKGGDATILVPLCQCALLNIIFGLYCGVEGILSRVILLRNILVSGLREAGFFNPEVSLDIPNQFLPVRITKHDERQRLAAYLFKVDAYISILRSEPPLLSAEDLHHALPSTYALHNAEALDIFDTRYSIEPAIRSRTKMSSMMQDAALYVAAPVDGMMLAEDVHLGICSLQSRLWHRSMRNPSPDFNTLIELGQLTKCLETWRHLLLRIPISEPDTSNFNSGQYWATRYYYGAEDHTKPGWQDVVYYRQKTLVYDGIVLYHLSNLQLYSNVRILSHFVADMMPSSQIQVSDVYQEARQRRGSLVREWVKTSNARRAICHAAALLGFYNDIPDRLRNAMDPIIYMALSISALVVWAYSSFANHNCEAFTMGIQNVLAPSDRRQFELTRWRELDLEPVREKEKEDWIEAGDGIVTLNGRAVCPCSLYSLISLYDSCIPKDWDAANTIAPGLFKSRDSAMEV